MARDQDEQLRENSSQGRQGKMFCINKPLYKDMINHIFISFSAVQIYSFVTSLYACLKNYILGPPRLIPLTFWGKPQIDPVVFYCSARDAIWEIFPRGR